MVCRRRTARYDSIARFYDWMLYPLEKRRIEPLRRLYVPQAEGLILDLAAGTGNNIRFYRPGASVVLVDTSRGMLDIALKKARELDRQPSMRFVQAALENMPFADDFFDTVVSIDVFCSVDNPLESILEVRRVLKPGGVILFVEHMLTGNLRKDLVLKTLNLLTVPTVGSSMTRRTGDLILSAGLEVIENEEVGGSFRFIRCTKPDVQRLKKDFSESKLPFETRSSTASDNSVIISRRELRGEISETKDNQMRNSCNQAERS